MFDSPDPPAAESDRAALLQNVYALDAEQGEGVVGRPGYRPMDTSLPVGGGIVQGFHQFTKLDGTELTVRIANGGLDTYDWGNRVWTQKLSVATLAAAGVVVSPTVRVAMVTFANRLVVSDGVHSPWTWDGTLNAGNVVSLTNAPALYGPMTVYSAKLVGIKATDRATFVWSEENDPTLGYQATVSGFTYANAWTIAQTDQNPLVAIRGTNAALYYWRERSIGAVFGKIASDFVTTATHDALSTSVGTKSPWGIAAHGEGFLFPDADGRPHRLIPGQGVAPIWAPFRETLKSIPRANLVDALAVDLPTLRLVLIGYTELMQTYPSAWLVYRESPQGFVAAGIWRGWLSRTAIVVKDGVGQPTFLHAGTDNYCYDHGQPDGNVWDDTVVGSSPAPIEHIVEAMPMAGDSPYDLQFSRLDLFTRSDSAMTLAVDYRTPRGPSAILALTASPPPGLNSYLDIGLTDVMTLAESAVEIHSTAGITGTGRWIAPRVVHRSVGERFGFLSWQVTAVPAGNSPFIP